MEITKMKQNQDKKEEVLQTYMHFMIQLPSFCELEESFSKKGQTDVTLNSSVKKSATTGSHHHRRKQVWVDMRAYTMTTASEQNTESIPVYLFSRMQKAQSGSSSQKKIMQYERQTLDDRERRTIKEHKRQLV
jgi:hypothetical protein